MAYDMDLSDIVDHLESWEEVEHWLRNGAEAVLCQRAQLVLEVGWHVRSAHLELYAVSPLRAQDRRRLHRLGFRLRTDEPDIWAWRAPAPDVPGPEAGLAKMIRADIRASGKVQRALLETALSVLRDALRLSVSDLVVHLKPQRDWLDEADD